MCNLVRTTGVVGQHDREPLLARGLIRKPSPGSHSRRNCFNAFARGKVSKMRELQIGIAFSGCFETHHARKQATIHLRQHNMHGEISRREAAERSCPVFMPRRGECHLEHRAGRGIERRRAVVASSGESGRVDDDRGRALRHMRSQPIGNAGSLQRRDEYAIGIKTLLPQRRNECIKLALCRKR